VYFERSESNAAGVSMLDVLSTVNRNGTQLSLNQLKKIIDKLLEDGLLYTTVDEEHHKIT